MQNFLYFVDNNAAHKTLDDINIKNFAGTLGKNNEIEFKNQYSKELTLNDINSIIAFNK